MGKFSKISMGTERRRVDFRNDLRERTVCRRVDFRDGVRERNVRDDFRNGPRERKRERDNFQKQVRERIF